MSGTRISGLWGKAYFLFVVTICWICLVQSALGTTNLLDNGGLTGEIPPTNGGKIPSVPPGWKAGYADVDMGESGGTGFFGETWPESPGGTQFVAAVSLEVQGYPEPGESFYQIVDDLEPGKEYRLAFYQANLGCDSTSSTWHYESDGYWQVSFGSSSFNSPVMPFIGFGADDFSLVETTFIADLGSQRLEFMAHDGGIPHDSYAAYIAIDDISLTLVPEPTTLLLLGVGGLALLRKRV